MASRSRPTFGCKCGSSTFTASRAASHTTGSQIQIRRLAVRKSVGVDVWPNSGMRHNFCSCHLAKFKDQNSLCLQSGHDDPDTMYKHYYKAITDKEAKRFWSIFPPKQEETKIVAFPAAS